MAKKKTVVSKLEALSEELVLTDASDLPALADLHTRFESLGRWAESKGLKDITAKAGAMIESIILSEVKDPDAAMTAIGCTVSSLLAIARDGRSIDEVEFPTEMNPAPQLPTLSAVVDSKLLADFLSQQESVLSIIEELALGLEKEAAPELLEQLRGIIHTLKGESGLMGLSDVGELCHSIEDVLQEEFQPQTTDLLFEARDWMQARFTSLAGEGPPPSPVESIINKLTAVPGPASNEEKPLTIETRAFEQADGPAIALKLIVNADDMDLSLLCEFLGEVGEHLDGADINLLTLESSPDDEEAINAVFRTFHTVKGVAGFMGLEAVNVLAHETENLLDKIRRREMSLTPAILDVIFDCVDALKTIRNQLAEYANTCEIPPVDKTLPALIKKVRATAAGDVVAETAPPSLPGRKLGEILVKKGDLTESELGDALEIQRVSEDDLKLGEVLVKEKNVPAKEVAAALRQQKPDASPVGAKVKETVKVDADRLDRLVDAIGEMVIAEAMLAQSLQQGDTDKAILRSQLGLLDKITREMQEIGTSLRMVPIKATFQKMARLVRDLSRKSGKNIDFQMSGEDTELDKSVVDRIGDPLVHMVRNSVDHGIETDPADRVKLGKPEPGRVHLRAFHRGGSIYIEIEDDGKGLDREAIIAKATERGLIDDAEKLSDREVWNLVLQPGFSTAKTVTDVSGRGVGMDVVKRSIEALRGQIDIQSEKGKGSTVSLRLPLTLAIIDGMVVKLGEERYIIPTLNIVRSLRPKPGDISTVVGRGEMISNQGVLLPLFRLGRMFEVEEAEMDPCKALIVVVEEAGRKVAIMVDQLLGQQQTVIKSLGEGIKKIDGISGGAVMPDGRVGLILDVDGLVRLNMEE